MKSPTNQQITNQQTTNQQISRRGILASATALASSFLLPNSLTANPQKPKRSLRIAYLTDVHLPNDPEITEKAAKVLTQLKDCDLVLFGGDNLMAIDHKTPEEVQAQLTNWNAWIQNLKKPYRCILGNHDIEQWEPNDNSPLNGKRRAIDHFHMKGRFWSEIIGGWKIIGLDTVHKDKDTFYGNIDPEQIEWLQAELANPNQPVLITGHMPLMTITGLANTGIKLKDGIHQLSTATMAANGKDLVSLFRKTQNVKLALSGHTHMIDRCDYDGTSYLCAGAVCGGWWNGANQGFAPAFHKIDLMNDGTFTTKKVKWQN